MEVPIQRKMNRAARKVDGTMVLRGPMQASEIRLGRNRPGRLAAFMAMSKLTEAEGDSFRTVSPKLTI